MSKYLKSLIIACLAACMTVCLGIFAAACTNNDDGKLPESVSVTVMLDENTPAVGVKVQLCATGANGLCLEEKFTNNQGVATIAIPEDLGKDYEVHLRNLDEVYDGAYQYVDGNGTPYAKNKGIQIDVTKNSSPKITLKAKSENTTTHTIGLDVETTALVSHSYVFTAPEAGYYLFTCDTEASGGWSLNDEVQYGNEVTIQLDKDATATVKIDYDSTIYGSDSCTIKVENGQAPVVGTESNPLALTLGGDAANFSVNLVNAKNMQTGDDILTWEGNYYATFTTDEAGTYKITFSFSINDDDLDAVVSAGYAQPSLDYKYVDGGMYFITTEDCTASTKYIVNIMSYVEDYTSLVDEGVTSLSYTVKVEYVADGGNEGGDEEYGKIVLGQTYDGDETIYMLVVETTGNYTFTTTSESNLFDLVVGNTLESIQNYGFGTVTFGDGLSTDTVELVAGTYYVIGYGGTFTITQ